MRLLIALFLILSSFFYCGADASRHEKPFLAVFSNPGTWCYWEKYKPNLYYTAKDFSDLAPFLQMVKEKLHPGQELILDIDCHGSEDGMLYIQYDAFQQDYTYTSTLGGLLNNIQDSGLKPSKLFLEACYARIVAETSLKPNIRPAYYSPGDNLEDYRYSSIDYPIYGIGVCPNISNLQWLSEHYQVMPFTEDLRDSIGKPIEKGDNSIILEYQVRQAFSLLYCYGR